MPSLDLDPEILSMGGQGLWLQLHGDIARAGYLAQHPCVDLPYSHAGNQGYWGSIGLNATRQQHPQGSALAATIQQGQSCSIISALCSGRGRLLLHDTARPLARGKCTIAHQKNVICLSPGLPSPRWSTSFLGGRCSPRQCTTCVMNIKADGFGGRK